MQKSFSAIRKDIDKIKKNTESRVDDIRKGSVHDRTINDTKVKFLTTEIRKLKDAHADLISMQKAQLDKLEVINKKHADELKHHVSHEISKVDVETNRLKSDIVKLVGVLKDKMVTRKLFDERNKVYDNTLRELLDVTRDIKDFKVNASLQVDKQISNAKEDIDVLKEEIASVNEELGELRTTTRDIAGLRSELSNYVGKEEFSQKLSLFDKMSSSVEKIDETLSELTELKGHVQSAVTIKDELVNVKNQLESELAGVRDNMLAKSDLEELRAKIDTLQAMNAKVDEFEETLKRATKTEQDIEDIRDELLALSDHSKEIGKLKKENEHIMLKVDTQQAKLDLLEATTPKKKEEKREQEIELVSEQTGDDTPSVEQPDEHGFFSKTMKGIADFFIEEDEPVQETLEPVQKQVPTETNVEVKEEKTKNNEQFIKNIEKIFDEKEAYAFDADVHSEIETNKPGIFSRLKSGVVNFLFEEVDDADVQPEITQEQGTITQEAMQQPEAAMNAETIVEPKKDKPKKAKKKVRKETKVQKLEKSETDQAYMLNKKPRLFEANAEEAEETSENGKKRKYKKVKGDGPLGEFAEEGALYPEDYFY